MIEEPTGIRVYAKSYCSELFEAKWSECNITPWFFVAKGFEKALCMFYDRGVFVAKLLGQVNLDSAAKTFTLDDKSLDLNVALAFSPKSDSGVAVSTGTVANKFRLCNPTAAREQFKAATESLGFKWDQVVAQITGILDKCYKEGLVMLETDSVNAEVLRSALEDQEAVQLGIRFRV